MRGLIVFIALFFVTAANSEQVELLRDPEMLKGLQYSHGTIKGEETEACRLQYAPKLGQPPDWMFVEGCEDTCFCHNPDNPQVSDVDVYYEMPGKSVTIDKINGEIIMDQDTSYEWNDGCSLAESVNGVEPDYNHVWDWNHLLLTQRTNIPLDKHESMTFSGEVAIEYSEKTGRDCKPQQALIYYALQLSPKVGIQKEGLPHLFAVARLWQTIDGEKYAPWATPPFIGADPGGNTVYISPVHPALGTSAVVREPSEKFQKFSIDAKRLSREALRAHFQATGQRLLEDDYRISVIIIGNETWGGYHTVSTFRDLSLLGEDYEEKYVGWHRYWHPTITNHFYGKYHNPNGFGGYRYEGQMGVTPNKEVEGMTPLYVYYNKDLRDHYYSLAQWPLGAGSPIPCGEGDRYRVPGGYCGNWHYAGVAAYVWTKPGPGRVPIYEMWNPKLADHLYSKRKREGEHVGYKCYPDCDTPRFYIEQ